MTGHDDTARQQCCKDKDGRLTHGPLCSTAFHAFNHALCVPDGLQADVPGHACINTSSQTHAHVSYLMGCQREHEPAESARDC